MQKSNILTNRHIGILILIESFLMVFAMLHHPQGVSNDPYQIGLAKWVHGSLIFMLIFNAFGMVRLSNTFRAKGRDTALGILFYQVGLGGFLVATMVSGFVQTSLIEFYYTDLELFSSLSKFAAIFNQAFAKLGVISFGAAGVLLFPVLIPEKGMSRLVAITGGIVGSILIISMLSGVNLSVMNMTLLTVLIVVWHCSIGLWFLKN